VQLPVPDTQECAALMADDRAPLRILHVVDSLERGGLERVVVDLAMAQRRHGDKVAVFSILETDGLRGELEAAGIPVLVGAKKRSFDASVLAALRGSALGSTGGTPADVVHAHNFVPNYYSAVALLGARRRPVLVGTSHDMGMRLSNRRLRWIYRWSLRRTARVAMVGRQVYERFVDSGWVAPERATLVRNGVPVERFGITPARRAGARSQLGLGPDALVIACVGRLVALKNHRLVIAVLPDLVAQHPDLTLVLLGGGALAGELQAQARALGLQDRIVFAGERACVSELLAAFDLFVMPSLTEGLSIALLEACATGLPVVATSVGGNPEIVESAQAGILVPPDNANALRDAVKRMLADAGLRKQCGANARAWVQAHASMEAFRETYDRFYREALGILPAPALPAAEG
jgi:glycosyltransferase involved in cell wall biosynthesis